MPSQNITALTNAAAFLPDALFYMAASPFGVTDDRKITGSVLFTTIAALDNNTAAVKMVSANNQAETTPIFSAGSPNASTLFEYSPAFATSNGEAVSLYSTLNSFTPAYSAWLNSNTDGQSYFAAYAGTGGSAPAMVMGANNAGRNNAGLTTIASSGRLTTNSGATGGMFIVAQATAPIVFATGGSALTDEKGRFDAAGFTLGKVSSITGALNLANSASAFLTTITAGNAAAARTYIWPTNFGASGSVLTDAAGNGTLSWVVPAAGGMAIGGTVTSGTAGSVLFVNAGPILAQDNANFFWDDSNNRLGLGTATPAKLLHVNGIAQLGTVSATTGQLQLANSASANLTTIQAGNAANARTYTWPTDFGASGSVLTDAAGNGVLSWTAASGGMAIGGTVTSGTTGSVLFIGPGPVLAQDNANFFWDDGNNRLGIRTASPSHNIHVLDTVATHPVMMLQSTHASGQPYIDLAANIGRFNVGVGGSGTGVIADRYYIYHFSAGGDSFRFTIDANGRTAINPHSNAASAILHVFGAGATATEAFRVDSAQGAATEFVFISGSPHQNGNSFFAFTCNTDTTADTNQTYVEWKTNVFGAAATTGFGSKFLFQLEDTTTIDQNAVAMRWYWQDAAHATHVAVFDLQTSVNGGLPISRELIGASKILTNNTVTTIASATIANQTSVAGFVDYAVEVFDGTDMQIESGSFTYQAINKAGVVSNTITFAGAAGVGVTSNYPKQAATAGTLVVTLTITAANPALIQINANSSLTPSAGFPRVTYTVRNLTSQATVTN